MNKNLRTYSLVGCCLMLLLTISVQATPLFWSGDGTTQGGAGTWNTTLARWSSAAAGPFTTVWANAGSDDASFAGTGAAVTVSAAITSKGILSINTSGYLLHGGSTITYNAGSSISVATGISSSHNGPYAGTITKTGAGSLTFNNANGAVTKFIISAGQASYAAPTRFGTGTDVADYITFNGGTVSFNTTTAWTMGKSVTVNSTGGTWTGAGTITVTCDKPIAGTSGTLNLNTMTWLMAGANTFAGTYNLTSGTLKLSAADRLADTCTFTVAGGTFDLNTFSDTVGNVNVSSGTLSGSGSTLTCSALTLSGGTVSVGTISPSTATATASATVSGIIGGSTGLRVTGGTLTLSGANTYSGDTTNSTGGTISINGTSTLGNGTGKLRMAGGTLINSANRTAANTLQNNMVLSADSTIQNGSAAASQILFRAGGTWDTTAGTGTLTLRNTTSAAGGQFDLLLTNGFTFSRPIVIGPNGDTLGVQLTIFNENTAPDQTYSGVISGYGTIRRSATTTGGNSLFTAANTYSGGTSNLNGNLGLGSDCTGSSGSPTAGPLGTGTVIQNGGGYYASGGARNLYNNLTFTGAMTVTGSSDIEFSGGLALGSANRNITVNNSGNTKFSGAITSSATGTGLTKLGTGTLEISGANTYTQNTTVSAGTLKVSNSSGQATGTGTTTVSSGGTLSGTGTVGAVTVSGAISGGSGVGNLTTGDETWNSGGTNIVEISDFSGLAGSGYDSINASSVNIASTSGSPFKIKVVTTAAGSDNFVGTTDYDLTIVHTTSGFTGNGASALTVDVTGFGDTVGSGGYFFVSISGDGKDLILSYRRAPVIGTNPTSATQDAGTTANFAVTATGSGSLSYQWKKGSATLSNGSQISGSTVSGATSANLTVSTIASSDADNYSCVVSSAYGSATSSAATLAVNPVALVITSPAGASSITNNAGTTVNLSVSATTYGFPTTYQWKKGGVNLANGAFANAATVAGASTANLTLTGVLGADAGDYTCAVTNAVSDATSAATSLYVIDPYISSSPTSQTVNCGSSLSLTVTVTGTTNISYQWFTPDASGTAITDATNSSLSFPNITAISAGSYAVVVSNVLGMTTNSATLTVVDTLAPTITLVGSANTNIECHSSFSDPGYSASDLCEGSVSVTPSGSVDVNTVGDYTLSYVASDSSNNSATNTRVVHVVDTTKPVVTLNGSASVTVECHGSFSDPGASADDVCAGSLSVSTSGSVNVNTPGDYTLTYSATDPSNNSDSTTRTVHVVDTTAPTFTVTGGASITHECHTAFTDPGVTASDSCSGSRTVTTTGSVDANSLGDYTLTYTADDGNGNTNSTTRTVHVQDTVGPVITLTGSASMNQECHTSFSDPGVSASDACAGSRSVTTTGSVDANTLGDYTLTYTADDGNGNTNSTTRTVHVQDTTAPTVTLNGPASTNVECHTSFSDPGASADDSCAGSRTVSTAGTVDANAMGDYTLTYTADDGNGNTNSITRTVHVVDTTAPTITLNGSASMNVECHASFSDPGASASDTCAGSRSVSTSGSVDANSLGDYTLTYTSDDGNGNTNSVTRTVHVIDTTAPVVTINGDNPYRLVLHTTFTDPGASASDSCEGSLSVTTSGDVDKDTVGSYTLTYSATDSSTNSDSKTRVVNVVDEIPPSISVQPISQTSECGLGIELGVDASGSGTLSYQWYIGTNAIPSGTNDTLSLDPATVSDSGDYTVVVSSAYGSVTSSTATLTIVDTTFPSVILIGSGNTNVECHTSFTDPGASASDTCAGSLSVDVSGSVDANSVGDYTISYVATDPSGNSTTNTRVVHVVDTTAPVLTLNGPSSTNIVLGGSFTDPGATANDTCAGSLSVHTSGSVDTSTEGTYTLTYTATDLSNNSSSTNRVVTVFADAPVIVGQPESTTNNAGTTVTFHVTALGSGLTYQWKNGASPISNAGAYSGADTDTLTISGVLKANEGNYSVDITKTQTTTSDAATLTVIDPAINADPVSGSVNSGSTYVLSVSAAGTGAGPGGASSATFKYQWYFKGTNLTATYVKQVGKTNATLTVGPATVAMEGNYFCTVTNSLSRIQYPGTNVAHSAAAYVTVNVPITAVPLSPIAATKIAGNNVTFTAIPTATATKPFSYQWYLNDAPLANDGIHVFGATGAILNITNVQSGDAGTYKCTVSNAAGSVSSLNTQGLLTVTADIGRPTVTILAPLANARLTNGVTTTTNKVTSTVLTAPDVVLNGTATDLGLITNVAIVQKYYDSTGHVQILDPVNVALFGALPGSKTWTNNFVLHDGTNIFVAVATDSAGNVNAVLTSKTYFFVRTAPFQVDNISVDGGLGFGTTTPGPIPAAILGFGQALDGAELEVGRNYQLKAIPGTGCFCTNITDYTGHVYTNGTIGTMPIATFRMTDGLLLHANFATNPIANANVAGSYNGLFAESGGVTERSAGMLSTLAVKTNLTYSGQVKVGGKILAVVGSFNLNGDSTVTVKRTVYGLSNLVATLHLDWVNGTKKITGTVVNSDPADPWSADASADLAGLYTAHDARYTIALQGNDTPDTEPGGYSFLTATNNALGTITLTGTGADGAVLSQVVPVSKDGLIPFYQNLYTNSGVMQGWIDISSGTPTGTMSWVKTAHSLTPTNYQGGFTNLALSIIGSPYTPNTTSGRAIDTATATFQVGDLNVGTATDLTWTIGISTLNAITRVSGATNMISGSIVKASGMFTVSFRPSGTLLNRTVTGVVMQNTTNALGRFNADNFQTGKAELDPP